MDLEIEGGGDGLIPLYFAPPGAGCPDFLNGEELRGVFLKKFAGIRISMFVFDLPCFASRLEIAGSRKNVARSIIHQALYPC